ncbi:hypothetical protein ACOSQ3_019726 [Xanthoceras sorbifolium]
MEEAEVWEISKENEPYGPWIVMSYGKNKIGNENNDRRFGGSNYSYENFKNGGYFGKAMDTLEEVDPDSGSSVREKSKASGALSDITNGIRGSKVKVKISGGRTKDPSLIKGTRDKLSPKINILGKVQNLLKKYKPILIDDIEDEMEDSIVLKLLHKEIMSFRGFPSSNKGTHKLMETYS